MDNVDTTLFYRNLVEEWCIHYDKNDTSLLEYLDRAFQDSKRELVERKADNQQSTSIRNALFVLGVGLLTYGKIDVLQDILDNIPTEGKVKRLANIINVVLPLPEELDSSHTSQILDWVSKQKDNLVWDDTSLKFDLASLE